MTPQTVHNHLRAILRTNDIVAARVHAAYAISELTGANAYALLSEAADERAIMLDDAAHESATRHSYGALDDHNEHVRCFKEAFYGRPCTVESPAGSEGFEAGRKHRQRHGGGLGSLMSAPCATAVIPEDSGTESVTKP